MDGEPQTTHLADQARTRRATQVRTALASVGDLIVVLLLMSFAAFTVLSGVDVPAAPRIGAGLIAGLFLPGYAVVSALFPRRSAIDSLARLPLSFAFSFAAIPAAALFLESVGEPVTGRTLVATITAATAITIMFATIRRLTTPVADRHTPRIPTPPRLPTARPQANGRWARSITLAAGLAGILFAGSAVSLISSYAQAQPTSELALLSESGLPEFYDRLARDGEVSTITLEVTNHEGQDQRYVVRILAEGEVIGQSDEFGVADGRQWQGEVAFTPPASDELVPVIFELYRVPQDVDGQPYRWVRLMMTGQ